MELTLSLFHVAMQRCSCFDVGGWSLWNIRTIDPDGFTRWSSMELESDQILLWRVSYMVKLRPSAEARNSPAEARIPKQDCRPERRAWKACLKTSMLFYRTACFFTGLHPFRFSSPIKKAWPPLSLSPPFFFHSSEALFLFDLFNCPDFPKVLLLRALGWYSPCNSREIDIPPNTNWFKSPEKMTSLKSNRFALLGQKTGINESDLPLFLLISVRIQICYLDAKSGVAWFARSTAKALFVARRKTTLPPRKDLAEAGMAGPVVRYVLKKIDEEFLFLWDVDKEVRRLQDELGRTWIYLSRLKGLLIQKESYWSRLKQLIIVIERELSDHSFYKC